MTRPPSPVTRRCALLVGGAGVATALAACTGASRGGAGTRASAGDAAATGAASSGAASSGASVGPGSPAAGSGRVIAALADVPVGRTAAVEVDGRSVLLAQPVAGEVRAFSTVCPHQGGQVLPDGTIFRCSLHGSQFGQTGDVERGPATRNLTGIAVTVSGGEILKG